MSESSLGNGRPPFEHRVVKVVRGREATTKAKMESQGWELVSQSSGALRTELTFRRPQPKTPLAYLQAGWARFRSWPARAQAATGSLAAALLVALVVAAAASGGGKTATAGQDPGSATSHSPSQQGSTPSPPTPSSTATTQTATGDAAPVTLKNNKDFAAIVDDDYCSDAIEAFATKYQGRTIEFDGSISAMNNHDDYKTRYDILVSMGPKGSEATIGPAFQFQDVNMVDLKLTDPAPDTVGVDDRLHVVAEVGEFSAQHGCLFQLDPIATEIR